MRQFKYKGYIFYNLLNRFIRDNDTYKNQQGEGILERFISVCEEYLDGQVNPEIDNMIDIINPEVTDDYFINLLWEYYGFIPYAFGVMKDSKYYTKDNLYQDLSRKDLKVDYRNLLKYAITLYKIRCTPQFYTILGKFYGVEIEIVEPGDIVKNKSALYDSEAYYDEYSNYDQNIDCLECLELSANVKVLNTTALTTPQYDNIKEGIIYLLNKYMPLHIKPFTLSNITFSKAL